MSDKPEEIFHLQQDKMVPMPERPMREGLFGKTLEDALQTLLENHPEVIPGKQISPNSEDPPRFILLRREMKVSGWSLDHLFVDQNGILTLVEAKLIQNPESRRDVIGQIIEYAANAGKEWSHGKVRQAATEYYLDRGRDLDEVLRENFDEALDIDEFWSLVDSNLDDGRLRLIIAGDEIRAEVRRMIEYLNSEMHRVDVLGLELKCYGDDESSVVLVPRIIGQTQHSADRRSTATRPRVLWTESRIRQTLDEMPDGILRDRLGKLLDWAVARGIFVERASKTLLICIRNASDQVFFNVRDFGGGHVAIAKDIFPHDVSAGKELLTSMIDIGLLRSDKSYEEIKHGRDFALTIDKLSENSFNDLLKILEKYSG